jgi:hypothetical protein
MIDLLASDPEHTSAAALGLGSDPEALRDTLRTLAVAAGYSPDALIEWCSADVPGAPADLPPLYYAAFLPSDQQADMPLGLGETLAAALIDLVWTLGSPSLLSDMLAERVPAGQRTTPRLATGSGEH